MKSNAIFSKTHKAEEAAVPDALRRLLDRDFPERAELMDRIRGREGAIVTRVEGSHVRITVSLRRRWAAMVRFAPSEAQLRRWAKLLRRTTNLCDFWLKAFVICAAIYLAIEIAWAVENGAVARALGGR